MKKQSQIDALRVRIERIEAKLAEQHKDANFGATEPSFIPDWKNAPKLATHLAMDKKGTWCFLISDSTPEIDGDSWYVNDGSKFYYAGRATNAHLLPEDYWKSTLQERPKFEVNPMPTEPDYTHLLPDGYEFCSEENAEKWVKVECPKWYNPQTDVGEIIEWPLKVSDKIKPFWRPIRPIVYHVAVHEAVTAVPGPYQVDWENAPEYIIECINDEISSLEHGI